MKVVCISNKTLFEEIGEDLTYNHISKTIEGQETYYDLKDSIGTILSMDGEECEVMEELEHIVKLRNIDSGINFKLSKNEFNIAKFQ